MKTIYYSPRASWTDDYIEALRPAITKSKNLDRRFPPPGGNRRFSNPSCCGRYRCVSWNGTNAWQFHKLGLAWQSVETEREDNSIVALPCEICGELCPPDKLMEHQEQFIQERDGVHRSGSASEKNVCSQAILLTSGSRDYIRIS